MYKKSRFFVYKIMIKRLFIISVKTRLNFSCASYGPGWAGLASWVVVHLNNHFDHFLCTTPVYLSVGGAFHFFFFQNVLHLVLKATCLSSKHLALAAITQTTTFYLKCRIFQINRSSSAEPAFSSTTTPKLNVS